MLKDASVEAVESVGAHFRLWRVAGPGLDGADFQAGDKTQVLLPSDDVRTYTPFDWQGRSAAFLAYLHNPPSTAPTPGPTWVLGLKPGDSMRFLGPQRSLVLPPGPVVVVGDETSIAVGLAYAQARPGQVHVVLEAQDVSEAEAVGRQLGLSRLTVTARSADQTHFTAMTDAILRAQASLPGATIGLTGGTPLIQGLRAQLKEKGQGRPITKAYWAPGKVGMD